MPPTSDNDSTGNSAEKKENLAEFILTLANCSPQEGARALNKRLLFEEPAGQAQFDYTVAASTHLVKALLLPEAVRRALLAELKLARDYEVPTPFIPPPPVATPLLTAMTSGKLGQVLDSLMQAPPELVPLLAEESLRQHKADAVDDWEGVRYLTSLSHLSKQDARNTVNRQVLLEWLAGAQLREEQQAQEQLLPERKRVVTEADRPRLEQRLQELSAHWEAAHNPEVQQIIRQIEQRLEELEAAQPLDLLSKQANMVPLNNTLNLKLSARQIALLYIFNEKHLSLDSRTHEIGRKYGFKNGRTIYDHHVKLKRPTGITGIDGRQLPSFIKDIEAVLPLVEERFRQKAVDSLRTLKSKHE